MIKRNCCLIGSGLLAIGMVIGLLAFASHIDSNQLSFLVRATPETYNIALNSGNSVSGTGEMVYRTTKSNNIKIQYSGMSSSSGNFGVLEEDGYLLNNYNLSLTHRNAIGKLNSIIATFDGDLSIDYSWGGEISSDVYIRNNISLTSGVAYTFADEQPNYFRIRANEDTTISTININYDCGTNEEYPNGYYGIKNETELKAFRDLVNGGDKFIDKTAFLTEDVTLTSAFVTPIGKTESYCFSGTFNGLGHTISNLTYTTSNTLGLFSRVTSGTVKNLKLDNISIVATGQRACGVVARAVDATIENIEVSGTISGVKENGGIVATVVAGSDKTIVKNCINRATITGSDSKSGGNGGIVGFVHSGLLDISNCINEGNITSTGSNNTGGIVGSVSGSITIDHCYSKDTAVIKNDSVTASSNYASGAGIICSGANRGGKVGTYKTEIYDESNLRTLLSSNDLYEDETVVVSRNLDMNNVTNNDDTDYSRSATFKGTFDGLGNTINHFKSTAASASMFNRISSGKVYNLKMKNVHINATTSRGASIASTINNSTIDGVEILSGSINGKTTNGCIVGAVDGESEATTIANCVNRASLTASTTSNGGILGALTEKTASLSMENCVNYGSITASGLAAGGVLGGTAGAGTGVIDIDSCVNYGNINGTRYVGGVIGIARDNSNEFTIIHNCVNYGNVTGSSNRSAGGVIGLTRFNVSSCQCYSKSIITLNKKSSFAYELSDVGGTAEGTSEPSEEHRGFIAGTTGNSSSANGYIVNDKGERMFEEFVANGNVSINQAYGRIQVFDDGRNILTMANRFSISNNPGYSSYTKLVNRDTSINSGGFGYDYVPGHEDDEDYILWLANMEPLVLPDGRLFIFYRTDDKKTGEKDANEKDIYYSSIRAIESRDNGATWLSTRHIIFENYTTDFYGDNVIRRPYEPFAVIDGNTLQIFIAFDAGETQAGGYGPDNSDFICTNKYQNLLRIPVDISNMGFVVGEPAMAIRGVDSYRRPGMPSVVKLTDGSYAMILEHNGSLADSDNYAMRIAISYSHDLITWTAPRVILAPDVSGIAYSKNASNYRYLCGAPYIKLLSDGKIAVSYTTNENFNYDSTLLDGVSKENVNYFRTVELAISSEVVTYDSTPTMNKIHTIDYGYSKGARYGGCAFIDDKIILMANEYTFDTSSNPYSRVVARGMVFWTAKYPFDY